MSLALADQQTAELQAKIRELAKRRNAIILAHNYQLPEVQDTADFVGDSLELARKAAETDADVILFCGVHFMAETAAITSPEKTVLLPDIEAGCSLADTITAEQLRAWKAEYPGAIVVSYVNTSAEVKAETDICCTSSNAVKVIESIPEEQEILFCPDMFLGSYVKRMTGRENMHIWLGECHVHAGIRPEEVGELRAKHSEAEFLIHPECGCSSQTLDAIACGDIDSENTYMLSTGQMLRHAKASNSKSFLIATETGILHRLNLENPDKEFIPVSEAAICQYMKKITLPKMLRALEENVHVITVDPDIAERARNSIDRMLAIG